MTMPAVFVTILGLSISLTMSMINDNRAEREFDIAACGEWRSWSEWLDGALILEQKKCPEGGKILLWARIQNVSDETLKVRVYAYKDDSVPVKCGSGSPSLTMAGTLPPNGTRTDWTYTTLGESLTPCAIREH